MMYKGFYIEITPKTDIRREDKDGRAVPCDGFLISVFRDESRAEKVDEFTAAVGFELLEKSRTEAEQLAMDYLGCGKRIEIG